MSQSQIVLTFNNYVDFFEFLRKSHEFLSVIEGTDQVTLNSILEKIMALTQSETDLIAAFNTATNAIAAKIDKLLNAPPVTSDNPDFVAALTSIKDGLVTLGADPANPVPTV